MKYLMCLVILALLLCSPVSAIIKPCTNCTTDLTDYAYLPGRSGGQTLNGGISASDNLVLNGSQNGGNIIMLPNGGSLGLGSTSPTEAFTFRNKAPVILFEDADVYQVGYFTFGASAPSATAVSALTNNYHPITGSVPASNKTAAFIGIYTGTATSNSNIRFSTSNIIGAAPLERGRFDNTGNFLLGQTSGTAQFDTTGTVRFRNYGAGTATFDAGGNITSVSDEKYKKNRIAYTGNYSKIKDVVPIQFNYNEASGLDTQHTYTGFSAQNLQAAGLGECVFTKNDVRYETTCGAEGEDCVTNEIPLGTQTLSVDDRCLLAVMFNSMKEKDAEIKDLKDKVKKLEDKVK